MTGLILLVFIAAIVAFGWTRLRGKMGMSIGGKHWIGAIVVVVLLVLMLYASSQGH